MSEDASVGFSVAAGQSRFDERILIPGLTSDCKVSARDTGGALCVFELTAGSGGPLRANRDQDEWIYVIEGEFDVVVGEKRSRASAGESVFIPRKVAHAWASASERPGRIINLYQPAGKMEEFFRELSRHSAEALIHEVLSFEQLSQLFGNHGMDIVGPPLVGEWRIDEAGRIVQVG